VKKFNHILPVILSVFWVLSLYGQESNVDQDVRVNQQAWLDYNFARGFDENRDITTQLGFRKITPEVYDRFLAISTMNFKNRTKAPFLKLIGSFHGGAGIIYTSNYDAKDNLEIRLLQGLKFHIPTIKPITLHNYIRFEQRFQNSFGEGWTTGFRFRYRLSTAIALGQKLFHFTKGIYFPVESELFINFKKADRFNDILRLSPGIGYKLPSGWKIEMYLIFNQSKNITETNNTSSDFILRIRVRNDSNRRLANQAVDDLQDNTDPTELKQQ
jgi:hypothetical protein